jgi:hypothetical protein
MPQSPLRDCLHFHLFAAFANSFKRRFVSVRNRPSPTNYISFGSFGCAQIVCDYVIAGMNGLLWAVRGVAISRFQAHVVS